MSMIRKAYLEDVPQIMDLVSANPATLLARSQAEISEVLDGFYVAEEEGRIVGCACLEVYSKKIAEIRSVAVHEDYRGRGIGTALVIAAAAEARSHDIQQVMVVTSSPKFFESLNFSSCLNEKYALFWNGPKE